VAGSRCRLICMEVCVVMEWEEVESSEGQCR
jgi:hypothetical protein